MPPIRPSSSSQEELYPAIARALLKSVSQEWPEVLLQIRASESNQIELEISGPAGEPNLRLPDDSLYEAMFALYDLFARKARPFARCDFRLRWDDAEEKWRFTADFTYPS
jgi:hypothetical protein